MGGESGALIRISPEGTLQIGTYKEAMPHIGETISTVKAEKSCDGFNAAFQCVCQLDGRAFSTDVFSNDRVPLDTQQPVQSTIVQGDKLSLDTKEARLKSDSAINT